MPPLSNKTLMIVIRQSHLQNGDFGVEFDPCR